MILVVNTADRANPDKYTSSSCKIPLPPAFKIRSVALTEVILPNAVYRVDSSNNVLYFSFGNIVVPPGFYSASTITTTIQALLQVVSPYYSVTINPLTYLMTISNSAFNFECLFSNTLNSLAPDLGFLEVDSGVGQSFTAPKVIGLMNPQQLYINIGEFGTGFTRTTSGLTYTYRFTVNVLTGDIVDVIFYDYHQNVIDFKTPKYLGSLNISLYDQDGVLINLNGINYQLVFSYEEE